MHIRAPANIVGREIGSCAAPRATTHLAESFLENIFETTETTAAASAASRRTRKSLRTEIEGFVIHVRTIAAKTATPSGAARAKSFEALETGFTFSVDFASIECLALVLVAEQFVRGI
jgi:hypothetical protein